MWNRTLYYRFWVFGFGFWVLGFGISILGLGLAGLPCGEIFALPLWFHLELWNHRPTDLDCMVVLHDDKEDQTKDEHSGSKDDERDDGVQWKGNVRIVVGISVDEHLPLSGKAVNDTLVQQVCLLCFSLHVSNRETFRLWPYDSSVVQLNLRITFEMTSDNKIPRVKKVYNISSKSSPRVETLAPWRIQMIRYRQSTKRLRDLHETPGRDRLSNNHSRRLFIMIG